MKATLSRTTLTVSRGEKRCGNRESSPESGFTLFELIVAMAITSILAAIVYSIGANLISLVRGSTGFTSREMDAQLVLDILEQDLENAVLIEGTAAMFAVTVQGYDDRNDSTNWKDASSSLAPRHAETNDFIVRTNFDSVGEGLEPDDHVYGWAGSHLRFFTAAPSVNAIGYQIIRTESFDKQGTRRYLLFRSVVTHSRTIAAGLDLGNPEGPYEDTSARAYENHPITVRKGNLVDVLLEDVVDFGVRLYVRASSSAAQDPFAPSGYQMVFPKIESGTHDANTRDYLANGSSVAYPSLVEVFVRILDREGGRKLIELESGEGEGSFAQIVAEHGRLYSRTVRLQVEDAGR